MATLAPPVRTAAITGGASGIGLAIARAWLERGGRAVLLDFDEDALERAVSELGAKRARGIRTDVTDNVSVLAAYDSITRTEEHLDAVVNCAGIARPAPSAEVSEADWMRLVDVHLNGTMRSCRAAYPLLGRSNRAAIVNVSSVAATSGMPGRASYTASKAGIDGLTRTLAVEWAQQGIRVNSIAPGYTSTPFTDKLIDEGKLDVSRIIERTPARRLALPAEIAAPVMFLLSSAASYVTGHTLVVDGGMTVDGDWYA